MSGKYLGFGKAQLVSGDTVIRSKTAVRRPLLLVKARPLL
jgi:hypothetical protein